MHELSLIWLLPLGAFLGELKARYGREGCKHRPGFELDLLTFIGENAEHPFLVACGQ